MEWELGEGVTENLDLELQWRRQLEAPASKFGSLAAHKIGIFLGQKRRRLWGIYRGIFFVAKDARNRTESGDFCGFVSVQSWFPIRSSSLEVGDDLWTPAVS
jgi:hypothetical protein